MTAPAARRSIPDAKVEYFLDCAQQAGELDAGSATALRLYGDDPAILAVVDRRVDSWERRRRKCLDLAEQADAILLKLQPRRRGAIVACGMRHVADEVLAHAEVYANWALTDSIDGGCLLPFRDEPRSKNGAPFKRIARRLRSPKFIRRYVKNHAPEARHVRDLVGVSLRRAAGLDWSLLDGDPDVAADLRAQIGGRKAEAARAERRRERRDRKVILRSFRAASSVLGDGAVAAFVRGEPIKLVGREAVLVLTKRGGLADRGHGCMSIALADRSGTVLADLCTFVEDTPTLDQLAAFALWMNAGEEADLLRTANVTSVTEAGRGHPLLLAKQDDRERARADLAAAMPTLVANLGGADHGDAGRAGATPAGAADLLRGGARPKRCLLV